VIGKIVLRMLVAAAKINQSSVVPGFDQTQTVHSSLFIFHLVISHLETRNNGKGPKTFILLRVLAGLWPLA
jgi:hypothetical protein